MQYKKYRIHLFATCFLVAMVSYAAITTMMYSLYNNHGLANVALVDGIFAYIGFGPTNMIVLHILRKLNLKIGLVIGFVGILLYQITILFTIISYDKQIPILSSLPVIYLINIVFSLLSGIANSLIWTIMPTYIQAHCDQIQPFHISNSQQQTRNSITAVMGLFWSIYMWSVIIGGLLNIFVLGYSSSYVYMILIIVIAGISILMVFIFVTPFQVKKLREGRYHGNIGIGQAIKEETKNLVDIIRNQNTENTGLPNIFVFNFIAGLYLSFYPIFMNKLIQKSLPTDISQQQFSRLTAIVFIFQGVGSIVTGTIQSKFYYLISQNKQKSLQWAISLIQAIIFLTMYTYNGYQHTGKAYWINILVIFGWSCTQTHIKTNTQAYIRQYNGGKVQFYSLSILFYSLGSIINYFIQMINQPNTQLIVLMFIGVFLISVWIVRQPDIQYLNRKADQFKNSKLLNNYEQKQKQRLEQLDEQLME